MSSSVHLTTEEIIRLKQLAKSQNVTLWGRLFTIPVLAFTLSLVTAVFSAYTIRQKDIHDQVAELGAAIQTLDDLRL